MQALTLLFTAGVGLFNFFLKRVNWGSKLRIYNARRAFVRFFKVNYRCFYFICSL